jgi:hypothetical protein
MMINKQGLGRYQRSRYVVVANRWVNRTSAFHIIELHMNYEQEIPLSFLLETCSYSACVE